MEQSIKKRKLKQRSKKSELMKKSKAKTKGVFKSR